MDKHGGGKRRTFSAEYKGEAVQLVSESGKSGLAPVAWTPREARECE